MGAVTGLGQDDQARREAVIAVLNADERSRVERYAWLNRLADFRAGRVTAELVVDEILASIQAAESRAAR